MALDTSHWNKYLPVLKKQDSCIVTRFCACEHNANFRPSIFKQGHW